MLNVSSPLPRHPPSLLHAVDSDLYPYLLVNIGSNLIHAVVHSTQPSSSLPPPPAVDSDLYPYLLVNIGSGVSIVKVDGHGKYERVSGSSLGGGTFWGLARLLTGRKDFDEVMQLSTQGDNANVRNGGKGAGGGAASWATPTAGCTSKDTSSGCLTSLSAILLFT